MILKKNHFKVTTIKKNKKFLFFLNNLFSENSNVETKWIEFILRVRRKLIFSDITPSA